MREFEHREREVKHGERASLYKKQKVATVLQFSVLSYEK